MLKSIPIQIVIISSAGSVIEGLEYHLELIQVSSISI